MSVDRTTLPGMTPDLLALLTSQCDVVTSAQAELHGLNRDARRALTRAGTLRVVRRGVYTLTDRWQSADDRGRVRICLAGALAVRGWSPVEKEHRYVGGLRTAAYLHELPFAPDRVDVDALADAHFSRVLSPEAAFVQAEIAGIRRGEGPRHIDLVSSDRCGRTYRNGVDVRPATLPPAHIVLNLGVPVTSLARTAVDLMREGTFGDAAIAADGALRVGIERAELGDVARFCSTWANGTQAVAAVEFGNALAESPAESLARVVCVHPDVPVPELQVDLYDEFGWIARVDLFFRRFRVVLEVDGLIKTTDPWCGDAAEALRRQEAREARLKRAGWLVLRVTWHELTTDPAGFLRRLLSAFAHSN